MRLVVEIEQYDIIILVEAREHQKDQLCRLLKQLEIGANPRHVYIAFGGTNVEQVRKSLYECPTNAPTAVAYYLPEPLFQVLHTFGRDIDLGIANLYQVLRRHFAHQSYSLSLFIYVCVCVCLNTRIGFELVFISL